MTTPKHLPAFGAVTQVLWAASGEKLPDGTTQQFHDTETVGVLRPFRSEIKLSLLEATDHEPEDQEVEDAIQDALAQGWIRKDQAGFWHLTETGSQALFPNVPTPRPSRVSRWLSALRG